MDPSCKISALFQSRPRHHDEPGISAHLRPVVPVGGAVYPCAPRQDLCCRDCRRTDRCRQAGRVCPGPGADPCDGHQGRAGARLSPAGAGATGRQGRAMEVQPRHADHRCAGARLRAGGRRPVALRDRGGVFAGPAEYADGRQPDSRRLGQFHHRTAGGHRRRHRFPAYRAGPQGRFAGHPPRSRIRRAGAAVAVRFFADRRGLQPEHGRRRRQRGDRTAGRQADLSDRSGRHSARPERPGQRDRPGTDAARAPRSCWPRCPIRCSRPIRRSICNMR